MSTSLHFKKESLKKVDDVGYVMGYVIDDVILKIKKPILTGVSEGHVIGYVIHHVISSPSTSYIHFTSKEVNDVR
jgi:hypothetical protein|tara:strand:- start:1546 stop:1770 length:225 start_codon:yes stop_codon:yes gene_type:complete